MTSTLLRRPLFGELLATPLNDAGAPPFAAFEADEEEESRAESLTLDYERPERDWAPIAPGEPPPDAPVRFVDGSLHTRTVAALRVGGRTRPMLAAVLSAAALEIDGRAARRGEGARTRKVLCLHSDGIGGDVIAGARAALREIGVDLEDRAAEAGARDFDAMRRAARGIAMEAMEIAERDVLLADARMPTLIDGLLERRLAGVADHNVPAIGLVKRQIVHYLPPHLQEMTYTLKPGERTPAFLLRTVQHVDLVNTYVRLSSPSGASPSYGVVRVTAPQAYVERNHGGAAMPAYLSGLAAYLYRLRHRDYAYARAGISVEPIVRVEDHLHAILPDIDVLVRKVHRLIGAPPEAA